MIIKSYELKLEKIEKFNFFLLYGKNEGFQNEVVKEKFINNFKGQIIKYEENEFINNFDNTLSELLNLTLFGDKKLLIISRVSDKIFKYIGILLDKVIKDTKIILKTGILEKKSKLRNLFEKNKDLVITPFYQDDVRSLMPIISEFLNKNKIKLSRESINLLIDRSSGDRNNLKIELDKIFYYSLSNKKIDFINVEKLTNLSENYAVGELADHYLSKNTRKVAQILNENNYSDDDCILIIRTILSKSKRLLGIIENYNDKNNIDEAISIAKPPVFWKDKEYIKKQVANWREDDLKKKIYEINEIEYLIKTNSKNTLNLVSDFIVNY